MYSCKTVLQDLPTVRLQDQPRICMTACEAVEFGIPERQAILSATSVPAKELGQEAEIGEISSGKLADFVVCDEELNRKHVYRSGTQLDS